MIEIVLWCCTYLINSLWQAPVIALAALLASLAMRRTSWRVQHALWVAALAAAVLLPAWNATWMIVEARHRPSTKIEVSVLNSEKAGLTPEAVRPRRLSAATLHMKPGLMDGLALIYLASVLYGGGALWWNWWKTKRLLRRARCVEMSLLQTQDWVRWTRAFGLSDVELLASSDISGPVTAGNADPVILVPDRFFETASRSEIAAALCHELAHVARQDYSANLWIEAMSLPITFHPVARWMKLRIDESRELICDTVAAGYADGSYAYARSLLGLAQSICSQPAATSHALGIFEANILEKRIMNLIQPSQPSSRGTRMLSIVLGCVMLTGACAWLAVFAVNPAPAQPAIDARTFSGVWQGTIGDRPAVTVEIRDIQGKMSGSVSNGQIDLDDHNRISGWRALPGAAPILEATLTGSTLHLVTEDADHSKIEWNLTLHDEASGELAIAAPVPNGEELPALKVRRLVAPVIYDHTGGSGEEAAAYKVGGDVSAPRLLFSVDPEYSKQARAAKFSGICVVALIVDAEGKPGNVHISKPLGMGLDENAIQAVKQYRFAPAMRNGVAVPVKVQIEVQFKYY